MTMNDFLIPILILYFNNSFLMILLYFNHFAYSKNDLLQLPIINTYLNTIENRKDHIIFLIPFYFQIHSWIDT